jgi:type 1 glutamine amidotransferase
MKTTSCLLTLALMGSVLTSHAADKKIVLIAGKGSHGSLAHEHNAGVTLFKKCLDTIPGARSVTCLNGWPKDAAVFEGADAIVLYSDGGGGNPAIQGDRLQVLGALMKKGVGLGLVHYAVEPTTEKGNKEFREWIGGCFEQHWSVNPFWEADFTALPNHPVARGVKPFKMKDEWYYHMRFRDNMEGVTPILSAIPPASTLDRPDGPHSNNPHVRAKKGQPQHVMWCCERSDGGRGFGFTGGHMHLNWGDDNFRKVVLNAILWIAKAEVPPNGVDCAITEKELMACLDAK